MRLTVNWVQIILSDQVGHHERFRRPGCASLDSWRSSAATQSLAISVRLWSVEQLWLTVRPRAPEFRSMHVLRFGGSVSENIIVITRGKRALGILNLHFFFFPQKIYKFEIVILFTGVNPQI